MKQKLGFLCAVLLLSCLLAAPSFAEDAEEEVPVGTAGQRLYHRHRYLYRRGPIASYNIGGTTVVSGERFCHHHHSRISMLVLYR